ncbi:MAG: hypothetical protein NVS2B7_30630 [Herpetosiphon sp.]
MKTIGSLLNDLFSTHRRPDGREYSCSDVARLLDGKIDPSYLARMRKGKIENPTRQTLLLLCQFFEISPNYFFPELEINAPPGGPSLQSRLHGVNLSPEVEEKLAALIQAMHKQT